MKVKFEVARSASPAPEFRFGNISSPYSADKLGFFKDGIPFYPVTGEFHFSRFPHDLWREELLKMRASGVVAVSTYVFWNHHERADETFDFTGDNDLNAFVATAKEIGMPVILRIGPWCHGEAVYGGFPLRIHKMKGKRSDHPAYLAEVEIWFRAIYREVAEFLDGETVLAIQIENEYGGGIRHMRTLRRLAVKIGFKTPFFTMTAWPYGKPDPEFLPLFGGYPEAPWTFHKKPLPPMNRFAITKIRDNMEIGSDLFKAEASREDAFRDDPYATCEIGAGNQITQHRRPKFGEKDGSGVAFAKLASGVNLLGYYMFHGGRNPFRGVPMQESRKTFYPNNMNVIDYDFQAPVSRWGYFRPQGARLRLLHEFTASFDPLFSRTEAFFPDVVFSGAADVSYPRCSVRLKPDGSGYFFVTSYERGLESPDYPDFSVEIAENGGVFCLPEIFVPKNEMFFYPFRATLSGKFFDWILAEPIAKIETETAVRYWFLELPQNRARYRSDGRDETLPIDQKVEICSQGNKKVFFEVLSHDRALRFFRFGNREIFTDAPAVYQDGETLIFEAVAASAVPASANAGANSEVPASANAGAGSEVPASENAGAGLAVAESNPSGAASASAIEIDGARIAVPAAKTPKIEFFETEPRELPMDSYLYSRGKRKFYELKIPPDALDGLADLSLRFRFAGSALQLFADETLIDDLFNYDGFYTLCLRQYRRYLDGKTRLTFKVAPAGRFGIGKYYSEIPTVPGVAELELQTVSPIVRLEL